MFSMNAGASLIDPFVSPLKVLSKRVIINTKLNLFRPKIPIPFSSLKLEGIIGKEGKLMVVAKDPTTGKIYLLAKGDAISNHDLISKVTYKRIFIESFYKRGKKLFKKINVVKINTED